MMHKLIREPLVHFLGGALLVFAFFWASGSNRDPADYAIHIDETDIERLKTGWVQNFRRTPTQAELDALIDQEIAEEIYYREALRLGLDKNDPVLRRRLFTKMRFIESGETADSGADDTILQQWMDDHPEKYALPPLYDFEQIYLGQIDSSEARQRIDQLKAGANPDSFAQTPFHRRGLSRGRRQRTLPDNLASVLRNSSRRWSLTTGAARSSRVSAAMPSGFPRKPPVRERRLRTSGKGSPMTGPPRDRPNRETKASPVSRRNMTSR